MDINIKLASSLIDAFDSEDTAIVLWDKNDNVIYRNKKTSERWIKLKLDFEIGQNFYDRIEKVINLGLMTEEEIQLRRENYELAKSSSISKEFVIKGPTGRWVQIKDTPTSEGNMLTLMTNVTHIVEQDLERKRLANAIEKETKKGDNTVVTPPSEPSAGSPPATGSRYQQVLHVFAAANSCCHSRGVSGSLGPGVWYIP